MALRLAEIEPRDYTYVCTPTGDELPEMVAHWKRLGDLLGKPILPVTAGVSLSGLIRRGNRLPNHRQRWCTRQLKLEPYYRWLMQHTPAVSYVGLRADEDGREGMNFPEIDGEVTVRFPMREWGWGEADVWAYLDKRGVTIPQRTDCARCYHQRLIEWWRLWHEHPDSYAEAEAQEAAVSAYRGKPYTFRNPQRDKWPAGLKELRERFEAGDIPPERGRRKTMCRVCEL